MNAILISIGDELLSGRTINTNAAWQGRALAGRGHTVSSAIIINDDRQTIADAITKASHHADVIFTTGGLGPTDDDLTRKAVCDLLDCDMGVDQEQRSLIQQRFKELGREPNERSLRQARVPLACEVILNHWGTAPGLSFELNNVPVYVLPGVPFEMRELFEHILENHLGSDDGFHEQVWLLHGLLESVLAERLERIEHSMTEGLSLAYLPSAGTIRLRLIRKNSQETTLQAFREASGRIEQAIEQWSVSSRDEGIAEALARELRSRALTLATAESCTGGLIGGALTDIPGSSHFYLGGVISYANSVKAGVLDVESSILDSDGAVSERTVIQMAKGVLQRIPADYGVAVTGIAGPGGGTADKPVGTVWIAVASAHQLKAKLHHFKGERDIIRQYTVNAGLAMVLRTIWEEREKQMEKSDSV
ncbi:MAG: CinA family nicotinamide mononucleotide deamidase-related protein [Chlorobi bacterium]|nr:CinA family nicotinamide mononucleotide deamidase-related protein [Chlorobiota bacterium]